MLVRQGGRLLGEFVMLPSSGRRALPVAATIVVVIEVIVMVVRTIVVVPIIVVIEASRIIVVPSTTPTRICVQWSLLLMP